MMATTKRPARLQCGPLELDVDNRVLYRADLSFHLTPKECRLLATFMTHQGQVLTRQFLMKEVWDTDFVADTRTLEVHVHWLRRKIQDANSSRAMLHTVRGVGYVLRLGPEGHSRRRAGTRPSLPAGDDSP